MTNAHVGDAKLIITGTQRQRRLWDAVWFSLLSLILLIAAFTMIRLSLLQ